MIKLSVLLNNKEYSSNICLYLINRTSFKIIAGILLGLIISAVILRIYDPAGISTTSIILWSILWILYIFLIPHMILKRSTMIYNNTEFLHNEMTFELTPQKITWTTSIGSHDYLLENIYGITATNKALIISFSPYQVIPIPYSMISMNTWKQLITIVSAKFPKIKTGYYQKYQNNS